ncbi:hypothetical protein M422DRAFT_34968 [Sphaerobolus stellatus SS14]|uniref:Unplaced genomic scaffold SPHSTscaffold_549, whole genome shotgun sequence n=1 Tax=Sphaerobolus stellatus (strain SS14) TaxID=990650 RepID=A0A0C9VAU0_SPHS4|nr:hypothetical protein M422DRAFT_39536 [Sphaerobolus stellatus SS14]KIJ34610.1 hypothetical protein M422DRAFT_34968 [Sphaerobolus stellatus SS14]
MVHDQGIIAALDILRNLRTPSLESLSIELEDSSRDGANVLLILSSWLCSGPASNVQKLYFEVGNDHHLSAVQFRTLLQGLPKLRDLTVAFAILDEDAVGVLNPNINPNICPHLTKLRYSYCSSIPVVATDKMIRSRVELRAGGFNLLQEFLVDYGRWVDEDGQEFEDGTDHPPILEALRKDFPSVISFRA